MNDLEETLRRTLGSASQHAPRMPTGLPAHLESGYRRRRRRGFAQAVLAAATVAVVAGGTVTVLRHGDVTAAVPSTSREATTDTPRAPEVSAWPLPEPVEQVWPDAVRKVPARGPGGTKLMPQAFIDDRTVLVTTWSGFEKTNALYAYDLDTGDLRKVADVPIPTGTVTFASDFTVGAGLVTWWTATKDAQAHLWTAPLTGGQATSIADIKVSESDGAGLDALAVEGDRIVFSLVEGGVFTIPATGGTPQAVPGSEGQHLLAWPWIGSPGIYSANDGSRFTTITNVETGETSAAVKGPGDRNLSCGVRLCTGTRDEQDKTFYRLRDGLEEKELPVNGLMPDGLARERFLVAPIMAEQAGRIVVLYDVTTGRSADLLVRADKKGALQLPGVARDGRLLSYRLGDDLYLIDLAKIT
ncbi:hypothetical protein HCN51_27720 [Nonomuraea sp. FMUSA5-5]|uniref:WD40 repeat domain-containing protein n=1 Tax=Nonomuraea composti TaxID=2720023 RepID=A0ABX1B5T4_9ACTN|nr:hypothetical protein [Nonomuraea sp. FMUSA5-5]NJP93190.1 hypothetical protein [Nonomuraea sp. FMUSA5-5]